MTDYPLPVPPEALSKIASELAIEYRTAAEILGDYGLGMPGQDPRTDALMDNTAFREIFEQIQKEWEGVTGTTQRIRLKSALLVEDCLPEILKMVKATDGDFKLKLDAFRQLSKMSGVEDEAKREGANASEKFVVNIRIGDRDVHSIEVNDGGEVVPSSALIDITPDPAPSSDGFSLNVVNL